MVSNKRMPVRSEADLQENRRGGLFLALVVLVIVLVGYSVVDWMSNESQVPLSEIMVEGDLYHISTTEIRNAVNGLGPLKSFMSQEVDHIQQAISQLPWVAHVSVRKQWPRTIKINITEHIPAAIWNGEKLLSQDAVIFDAGPSEAKFRKLVSLSGPEGSEQELLQALPELREILKTTGLDIAELILSERLSWRIITSNNIRIELGLESKTERLERFVKLFNEIKASGQAIDYIDLRYDVGLAVGWKTQATTNQL